MEEAGTLRQRAEEHRTIARITPDLWESVVRFNLAAGYDALAARREQARSGGGSPDLSRPRQLTRPTTTQRRTIARSVA